MYHHVDIAVGKRIRDRRRLLGFSQKKLADAAGIKFQQIQKYETGANRVSASRLWEIAKVLDTPIPYFFNDVGGGANSDQNLITTEMARLFRMFNSLSVENKRNVINLLRGMTKTSGDAGGEE